MGYTIPTWVKDLLRYLGPLLAAIVVGLLVVVIVLLATGKFNLKTTASVSHHRLGTDNPDQIYPQGSLLGYDPGSCYETCMSNFGCKGSITQNLCEADCIAACTNS